MQMRSPLRRTMDLNKCDALNGVEVEADEADAASLEDVVAEAGMEIGAAAGEVEIAIVTDRVEAEVDVPLEARTRTDSCPHAASSCWGTLGTGA
jgi:hypothetical protein